MTKAAYDKIAAGLEDAIALTTPEVQAAVEHLKAVAMQPDGGYSSPRSGGYADAVMGVYGCLPERQFYADISAVLEALADSEARRGEVEGDVRKYSLAIYAVTVQLNNFRIPMKSRVLNALEAIAALNPQQEGSRDHG